MISISDISLKAYTFSLWHNESMWVSQADGAYLKAIEKEIHRNSLQLLSLTVFLPKNTCIADIFDGKTARLPKMSAHLRDSCDHKSWISSNTCEWESLFWRSLLPQVLAQGRVSDEQVMANIKLIRIGARICWVVTMCLGAFTYVVSQNKFLRKP